MKPLIAVLMCAYNAEKFLRESVESVLVQSYGNFVFFVCNDGSTDATLAILQGYAARDPRLRVLENPHNMGIVATRNRLLSEIPAETEFAAWLDADDVMLPDRLQKQSDFLMAHPEIGGVSSALEIINENSEITGFRAYPTAPAEIRRCMLSRDVLAQPAMMLKCSVIRQTGFYSEQYPVGEDYDYWLRAMDHTDFANLPEPVIRYRISTTQSKRTLLKKTLTATLQIQRDHFRRLNRRMPFSVCCYQLAGRVLLLLPSGWILKLFNLLTYRRKEKVHGGETA